MTNDYSALRVLRVLACTQIRVKCETREIFSNTAYTDAIQRRKSIFVQLYNMKSISSAASGNRREYRVKRKIRKEGEMKERGR